MMSSAGTPSQLPAGVLLHVAVLLGFSILTLVVLLRSLAGGEQEVRRNR